MIFVLLINLSGCWDAQDIEEMSFPIAAAYDLHDGSKNLSDIPGDIKAQNWIDVTTLTPNLASEADTKIRVETQGAPVTAFARNRRALESGRVYQPAMVQALIIGEELARVGLNPYLDALYRVPIISSTINFAVADIRGEDILKTEVDDYTNTGTLLRALLRKASNRAFVPDTTLHDIGINNSPGKNPVLPLIKQTADKKGIQITGSAVFNKDKMMDSLNMGETRSLVLLRGIKSSGRIPFLLAEDEKIIDSGTLRGCNSRKVKVTRNGDSFSFLIKIEIHGCMVDHTNNTTELSEKTSHAIAKQVAADIKSDCDKLIKKMQEEWEIDCIDISKYALAKWRKELTPVIDNDFIQNTSIQVEVEVKLENCGELI
ncbi:MAG: Ger(x)C family spore germination protein [Bacillota bacterium]|nr:Ger(x)C family spore germination protein [Bacillota bacterium]